MNPTTIEILATVFLFLGGIHTFLSSQIRRVLLNGNFRSSFLQNLFGEVEFIFGFWAVLLLIGMTLILGSKGALQYMGRLSFHEPLFVFVILLVTAAKPVIEFSEQSIVFLSQWLARWFSMPYEWAFYSCCLVLGPLMGSLITEPAAMTVTAWVLKKHFYQNPVSLRFKYLTLALIFVNISIGGVLTPFAAPPILMVAHPWGWTLKDTLHHFGWKVILAILLNAGWGVFCLRAELTQMKIQPKLGSFGARGRWVYFLFLAVTIHQSDDGFSLVGIFACYLAMIVWRGKGFKALKMLRFRESIGVTCFLGGLVILGGLQKWWLEPFLKNLNAVSLFLGTTFLTSWVDNALLTFLGSQVEGVTEGFKYALVAGAIAGGGMTVIANAPNPIAVSILEDEFGVDGVRAGPLWRAACVPTVIAMACLWLFSD